MNTTLELELPTRHYEQLSTVAKMRERSVADIVQDVLVEWLEEQARLEHARALMRELGHGLGEGAGPNDVARNHDNYLYRREQV